MNGERAILRWHTCGNIQRDRRVYSDHLLRAHGEMSRRGLDAPVRFPDRELATVWASVRRLQTSGNTPASRCREELGLLRVSDCEAELRLRDNRPDDTGQRLVPEGWRRPPYVQRMCRQRSRERRQWSRRSV